uniref:(California timema) hypothetical protein n=1 Tax=Timema californicum TaxID=61474 RepID=A0A7R9IWI0_TIMCA|nr:unnamed protein product [Timema californicum]
MNAGTKWKSHRKMITPTFHFKILENFVEVFVEKSEILVRKLEVHADKETFNIYPYITRCALDIICETAMGTQINSQEDTESNYVSAVYGLGEELAYRMIRPWLHPDFIFLRTKRGKHFSQCLSVLHKFTDKIIQSRKVQLSDRTNMTQQDPHEEGEILGEKYFY